MRKFTIQVCLVGAFLYAANAKAGSVSFADTPKISHRIDGKLSEWKVENFETDKETQTTYGIDHDATNLYVAMKVADQRVQVKMMMQGMNIYIDKKGKKKEGTGIEFPINSGTNFPIPESADLKGLREALTPGLVLARSFGLEGQEDKIQELTEAGRPNIAFSWDDANNMYIEYIIPLAGIDKTEDLKGKELSVGWRLNSVPQPETEPRSNRPIGTMVAPVSSSGTPGVSSSGRVGRGAQAPAATAPGARTANMTKERSFWTRYTISL
jgi:hypothetical protein